MSPQTEERVVRTYAGWFNERRVFAFNLTPIAFASLTVIVVVTLGIMFTAGVPAALTIVVVTLGIMFTAGVPAALTIGIPLVVLWLPLIISTGDKSAYEALLLGRQWGRQRRTAQHIYRAGPLSNQPAGVPGCLVSARTPNCGGRSTSSGTGSVSCGCPPRTSTPSPCGAGSGAPPATIKS
ncbi:hypothetical protein BJF84_27340 [Rhodococcus sp. CUA-806]|nr:hypothetical protein BJF84_27340 [Rhodococcus sp. CUA-806]